MEKSIRVFSYAKINLSIDVGNIMPSGMHPVDMVMQQIALHDDVNVKYSDSHKRDGTESMGGFSISLSSNRRFLPNNKYNLAWRAATLMIEEYGNRIENKGSLEISLFKRIPVAAGMAGGSSNAAAVMHAINALWDLDLSLDELCEKGAVLGSDIPFCLIAQAKCNNNLPHKIVSSPKVGACARARGTGTDLQIVTPLRAGILVATPKMGVSTGSVFSAIDSCEIVERPDNDALCRALKRRRREDVFPEMINVLEEVTLKEYPEVAKLKQLMTELCHNAEKVLMSGSGPTIYAVFFDVNSPKEFSPILREKDYICYWTKTML